MTEFLKWCSKSISISNGALLLCVCIFLFIDFAWKVSKDSAINKLQHQMVKLGQYD